MLQNPQLKGFGEPIHMTCLEYRSTTKNTGIPLVSCKKSHYQWDALQKGGWQGLGYCCLCYKEIEVMEHIFFDCSFVKKIWRGVFTYINGINIPRRLKKTMDKK